MLARKRERASQWTITTRRDFRVDGAHRHHRHQHGRLYRPDRRQRAGRAGEGPSSASPTRRSHCRSWVSRCATPVWGWWSRALPGVCGALASSRWARCCGRPPPRCAARRRAGRSCWSRAWVWASARRGARYRAHRQPARGAFGGRLGLARRSLRRAQPGRLRAGPGGLPAGGRALVRAGDHPRQAEPAARACRRRHLPRFRLPGHYLCRAAEPAASPDAGDHVGHPHRDLRHLRRARPGGAGPAQRFAHRQPRPRARAGAGGGNRRRALRLGGAALPAGQPQLRGRPRHDARAGRAISVAAAAGYRRPPSARPIRAAPGDGGRATRATRAA